MDFVNQNWILILLIVFVVFWLFRRGRAHGFGGLGSHHGHGDGYGRDDHAAQADRAASATDPVSGRSLDTQHAITTYFRGRVYFFENEENRRRFETAPENFAKNAEGLDPAARSQRGHRRHGC